ncbi:MAG: HAD-IIA family hydrolase [bacterium]
MANSGQQLEAILLDMDGVLYHGDVPLPGAAVFLDNIREIPHLFLTNNPILTVEELADKFIQIGLPAIDAAAVLTSGQATALYLHEIKPGFRFMAVGAPGLSTVLGEYGIEDNQQPDFVVIGEGVGLDYDILQRGLNHIVKRNAVLISTNPDATVDDVVAGVHRLLPGGGALVAPFEVASGRKAITIGKPERLLFELALEKLNVSASCCVMVGDRPDTDIAGAAALGIRTALVRTGRFARGDDWPAGLPKPDWDVDSLDELYNCWLAEHLI